MGSCRDHTDVDTEDHDLVGAKLGHFEILSKIGRGGMGHVFRALDTSLQRYVAVKVLRSGAGLELDTQGEQRLMREAIAQARVHHPNIVTIFYVGREQDTPFLAMELIDGSDVSELIKKGPVSYEYLSHIAIKITHALDVAAQLGIVHADIKPQNLLVLPDGEVKLSDFGMARLAGDDSLPAGGTPNYLAPELLSGHSPTIQSDMYALGVTLYEMSFQQLPVALTGSTVQEWSNIHANTSIGFPEPWPDHLPKGWRDVLKRLLANEPADRFDSYESLGQQLTAILPSSLPPAKPVPRAIAYLIDLFTVLLTLVLLQVGVQSLYLVFGITLAGPWLQPTLMFTAIGLYTLVIGGWRQSLGRELLHVRIINQYGLEPTRRKMILRSILRMMLFWGIVVSSVFRPWFYFAVVIASLALLFVLADAVAVLFLGRGTSLHDRVFKTRAVVGQM